MADQDDDPQRRVALCLVFGVVAAVIISVLAFATTRTLQRGATLPAAASEIDAVVDVVVVGEPMAVLYFEIAKADLPGESAVVVSRVVEVLKVDARAQVFLSGFHDATGDAAKNAELAKQRAKAVRGALQGAGVAVQRVVLVRPAVTTGEGTDREARRVEIRVVTPQ